MISRFSSLIMVLVVLVLVMGCGREEVKERPRDPFVFRSVLDERPRIVTAALHENLWVAYDARYASLYKAWMGGVSFDGAVYTTAHGPQPTSMAGATFMKDDHVETRWSLTDNGSSSVPEVVYKGHRVTKTNRVTFTYHLINEGGEVIVVEETPEYIAGPGLVRNFTTSGVPDGTSVGLQIVISSPSATNSFDTDGEFSQSGDGDDLQGTLTLNSNDDTQFTTYFEVVMDDAEAKEELSKAMTLINGSDCATCHNETERTVGPSYKEIAERYEATEDNIILLTTKVIEGGTGVWGEVPMTAHPNMAEEDARTIVEYILSLREERDNSMEAGIIRVFAEITETRSTLPDLKPGQNFNKKDVVPNINQEGVSQFYGKSNFLMWTGGLINIPETTKYSFRLESSGAARLMINDKPVLDHSTVHDLASMDTEVELTEGQHQLGIQYYDGGKPPVLRLLWAPHGSTGHSLVPAENFITWVWQPNTTPGPKELVPVKRIPGDTEPLQDAHPSFDVQTVITSDFQPKVGGMDFLSDGRMVVCTWDSLGSVYIVDGVQQDDTTQYSHKKIAAGLAEPLGLKVVDDEIFVLQKQELTQLVDTDGDDLIDEYKTVSGEWGVTSNFHEFAFGLIYKDGYFYATLATAILPGGASAPNQEPHRGKVVKISREDGSMEVVAGGLRTPNGIGFGIDGEIFVADNQGDWLPSSKIVHIQEGGFYGQRSVEPEVAMELEEDPPVVWLPQDDIGNSPSQPGLLNIGPYKDQMIHGEVTHGGVKRVFVEKVNGEYQGAVFRFTQGLMAGINRIVWGPDGALYVGGVGNPGNWGHIGKLWYGIQRLTYNEKSAFEMLAVRAKTDGMEIEFTEPLGLDQGNSPGDYTVRQWWYEPTEAYGGPKMDEERLAVRSVNISDDRKKVFLELEGMKEGHVVHFRTGQFISASNNEMWSTEAWYTLNQIPEDDPGTRTGSPGAAANTLTQNEIDAGWKLLFDGNTTNGWKTYNREGVGRKWKVVDGTLHFEGRKIIEGVETDKVADGGLDIITVDDFQNFEFALEWKISPKGNSGLFYTVVEDEKYEDAWKTSPEMQVLDNQGHDDASIEKHRAGDLYDMISCKVESVNAVGEWNKVRIIKNGANVQHWLNGIKVVEYEINTDSWWEMVENSKFKTEVENYREIFGTAERGHIGLQDHDDPVWFRNIKIKEL